MVGLTLLSFGLMTLPLLAAATPHPLLIGYFPQWGLYSQPAYLVKNLVTSHSAAMLDQVNYAQGFVTNGRCSVADPNADLNHLYSATESVDGLPDFPTQPLRGSLNQFLKLKRLYPRLKLILSLEGQAASFAQDAQPDQRQAFVASCVDLFLRGNLAPNVHAPGLFDGIDIDWEFPRQEDAANFLALLAEFRRQFDALRAGILLNIAVGHSPRMAGALTINGTSDLSAVSDLVDQVGLMTYDYTGPWAHTTGFVAPYAATQRSVQDYLAAGVPASKLVLGVPFYGYGWQLVPEENNGLFQEGEPIRGDRPYSYIETLIPHSTVYRDRDTATPWLFDGDAFWTYEDPTSVRIKTSYALDQHLGGLMFWELSGDTSAATLLQSAFDTLRHPTHATATLTP